MKRLARRILVAFLVAAAALYLADWGVWRLRLASGSGMGMVSVSRIQVAALKGNKEEYYWDGTADLDCSRSIFPHAAAGACWWLLRHNTVVER